MKKISIIVPVYNSEKNLKKCLNSLVNQSYKNIEIIMINDGSVDGSLKILNEFKKKYDNVIVIDKANEGVAKTRNLGIKKASGDYIMFVDNDDYVDKDYVEKFVCESGDYDIIIGGYERTNINEKVIYKQELIDSPWSKYIVMAPWSKLYKRKFLIKNDIEFLSYPIGEDVYFNLFAFSKKPSIKIINYQGYKWFYNDCSVSNTSQRGLNKNIDITYLLDKIYSKYNNISDDLLNYYYMRYYIWYLLFSGRKSTSEDFLTEYKKIKKWFKSNNIKCKINPLSNKIKGESFKNRFIVLIFRLLEILHLVPLFSKIYCRGE